MHWVVHHITLHLEEHQALAEGAIDILFTSSPAALRRLVRGSFGEAGIVSYLDDKVVHGC